VLGDGWGGGEVLELVDGSEGALGDFFDTLVGFHYYFLVQIIESGSKILVNRLKKYQIKSN
jgi:hypothetical protein